MRKIIKSAAVACAVAGLGLAGTSMAAAADYGSAVDLADAGSSALSSELGIGDYGSSASELLSDPAVNTLFGYVTPYLDQYGLGSALPSQPCNASTKSGHDGITDTIHSLGRRGPATFRIDYETYSVPDNIEVWYNGVAVAATGYVGDAINQGTGSLVVHLPLGASSNVMVRVYGGNGTDWDYTVGCPF